MRHLYITLSLFLLFITFTAKAEVVITPQVDCICEGQPQQAFTVNVDGDAGPFFFEWSNEDDSYYSIQQNPEDIDKAGLYTLKITDAYGCSFEYNIELPACEGPTFTFQTEAVSYCDPMSGEISLLLDDEITTFQIKWYKDNVLLENETEVGVGTFSLTNIEAGTYHVEAIDIDGDNCIFTSPEVVVEPTAQILITSTITNSCIDETTGSVDITITSGTSPFTFAWSNGATSQNIDELSTGTYTVTINDNVNCQEVFSFDVAEFDQLTITPAITPPNCQTSSDASIELLFDIPGNYSFLWNTGATINPLTNIGTGAYSVTVTDDNGCEYVEMFDLYANDPIVLDPFLDVASCNESEDGAILVHANGGTPPYSYDWGAATTDDTPLLQNIPADTYYLTVTDVTGCEESAIIELGSYNGFEIDIQATDVICQNGPDGSLTVTTQGGGTGNYSYNWSKQGDPSFTATTATISNLDAGTYCVTLTDNGNGCTYSACQDLERTHYPFIERVVIKAEGPSVNTIIYDASWVADANDCMFLQGGNTPEFTNDLLNLMDQGVITLQVTALGNLDVGNVKLFLQELNINIVPNNVVANTIEYEIDASLVAQMVVDNAISQSFQFEGVDINGRPIMDLSLFTANGAACAPLPQPTDGCGWTPSPYLNLNGGNGIDITHILIKSCFSIELAVVPENKQIYITQMPGVTEPILSVEWENLNPEAVESLDGWMVTGLNPGQEYCVVVTDATGCQVEACAFLCNTITEDLYSFSNSPPCPGDPNSGIICLDIASGISVDFGQNTNGNCLEGLTAGNYSVTLTDFVCGQELVVNTELDALAPALSISLSNSIGSCPETPTGYLNVTGQGGRPPYSYLWDNGATTKQITDLDIGTYSVTVTDACDTPVQASFEVPDYYESVSALSINLISLNESCPDESMGSITIEGQGGKPPYTFMWSNGATTSQLENLDIGFYSVTMTDDCGTPVEATYEIPDFEDLTVTNIDNPCLDVSPNGDVEVTFSGGFAPYLILVVNPLNEVDITSGVTTNSFLIEDVSAGVYTIKIYDNCQRFIEEDFVVADMSMDIIQSQLVPECKGGDDGNIEIMVDAPYNEYIASTMWSTGVNTHIIEDLSAGHYEVTVSLENGCMFTEAFDLVDFDPELTVEATNTCSGQNNGAIDLTFEDPSASDQNQPYFAFWSSGQTWEFNQPIHQQSLLGLSGAGYIVTVTNNWGCSIEANDEVITNPIPVSELVDYEAASIIFDNQTVNNGFLEIDVPFYNEQDYTIMWSTGANTKKITNLAPGDYGVTITDIHTLCTYETTYTVNGCLIGLGYDMNVFATSIALALTYEGGAINISVTGGDSPYNYQWTGPGFFTSTEQNISGLDPGTYCVLVHDDCGRRSYECFEMLSSCPDYTIDLTVLNQCSNNHQIMRLESIIGADIGEEFTLVWSGPGIYDTETYINGSGSVQIEPDQVGTYSLQVTDQYGCISWAWAEFVGSNGTNITAYMHNIASQSEIDDFLGIDFSEATIHDSPEGSLSYADLLGKKIYYRTDRWELCGCQSEGDGWIHCPLDCDPIWPWQVGDCQTIGEFCFTPNGGTDPQHECHSGGTLKLPGLGYVDVPAGSGWKVELNDKCGCIFPRETFQGVFTPSAFVYNNGAAWGFYGPLSYAPEGSFIFAVCDDDSCSDDLDNGEGPGIANPEKCIYHDEDLEICYEVTFTEDEEGTNCIISNFELVAENCTDPNTFEGIPPCEACPNQFIKPFWCNEVGYCTTGYYYDENENSFKDDGEQILYQDFHYSDAGPCLDLADAGIQGTFNCPDCFVDQQSFTYGDVDELGDCWATVICGGEETVEQGNLIYSYVTGENSIYNCPELCNGGHFCIRNISCDLGFDLGIHQIDDLSSIATAVTSNNQNCIPPNYTSAPSTSCTFNYYCGVVGEPGPNDTEFHSFCVADCTLADAEQTYFCNSNTVVTCDDLGVTPVAIVLDGSTENEEGEMTHNYSFKIVEEESFVVSSVFPNPFQTELTIKLTASYEGIAQISLVNLLGQSVITEKQSFVRGYNPLRINISGIPLENGLYHLVLEDERGNSHVAKVVLSR